jgi:hypothetical protein
VHDIFIPLSRLKLLTRCLSCPYPIGNAETGDQVAEKQRVRGIITDDLKGRMDRCSCIKLL